MNEPWTSKDVWNLLDEGGGQMVADAHNASRERDPFNENEWPDDSPAGRAPQTELTANYIRLFVENILHGDDAHKLWLKEAAECFIDGRPMPERPCPSIYRSGKMTETVALPSEATHWYDKQGNPVYEVPKAKGDVMRATTISDARKLNLVPSVTSIIGIAAKPGLQKWKLQQMLHAALTLPRIEGETEDEYAERIILDSETQSKKAMERGTELHAAIEQWIQNPLQQYSWERHIAAISQTLLQYGVDLLKGKAEHSFASPLGYGGKLDWHNDEILIDFKTKDRIVEGKQLAWPEHCYQLAAYEIGISTQVTKPIRRLINVFIGVEDCSVRIHEWTPEDSLTGWEVFSHLLAVWKLIKNYNP